MNEIKNVCVFCASAMGARAEYAADAEELGRTLAARGIGLIYGGAKVGLMGVVADATLNAGGRVVGVIPQLLVDHEVAHQGVTELHIVKTMHERKSLMGELADGFIILPGGLGTFEELFEVLAWQTLRIHDKNVVLLNTAGFYDPLLAFLDHCVREGTMNAAKREIVLIAKKVDEALELLTKN